MGRMDVQLEDNVIREFKMAILRRMGPRRGSLKDALQEAIHLWLVDDYIRLWYKDKTPLSQEYLSLHSDCMKEFKNYIKQKSR